MTLLPGLETYANCLSRNMASNSHNKWSEGNLFGKEQQKIRKNAPIFDRCELLVKREICSLKKRKRLKKSRRGLLFSNENYCSLVM